MRGDQADPQRPSQQQPGHLVPGDEGWTAEKVLVADLSTLNAQVSRYVLRLLDVDAGRAEPVSLEDEQALGLRLAELGERVQGRANQRAELAGSAGPVIDGEAQPQAFEPEQPSTSGTAMDNGP